MSQPIRLRSPRYRLVVGDVDDPSTWRELFVQSITPDLARAEALFNRHKEWGKATESAIKLTEISAYYALVRDKQIESGSWEAFEPLIIEVNTEDDGVVDPTRPEPGAD